jgi:hypothetical protein
MMEIRNFLRSIAANQVCAGRSTMRPGTYSGALERRRRFNLKTLESCGRDRSSASSSATKSDTSHSPSGTGVCSIAIS